MQGETLGKGGRVGSGPSVGKIAAGVTVGLGMLVKTGEADESLSEGVPFGRVEGPSEGAPDIAGISVVSTCNGDGRASSIIGRLMAVTLDTSRTPASPINARMMRVSLMTSR